MKIWKYYSNIFWYVFYILKKKWKIEVLLPPKNKNYAMKNETEAFLIYTNIIFKLSKNKYVYIGYKIDFIPFDYM